MDTIEIYCDGGCRGNQNKENIGGWGALINYKENKEEYYGGTVNTTNNIMEITSCINALKEITKRDTPVVVTMDSQYVIKGINEWVFNWIKKGWKTSTGNTPKNLELWKELHNLRNQFNNITFEHCMGHKGNIGNERADGLANIGMDEIEKSMQK